MRRRILVAVDGSRHARTVLESTAQLAKATSSNVFLLYVVPEYKIASDDYPVPDAAPAAASIEDAAERIVEDGEEVLRGKGVECEGSYEYGNPSVKILEAAESKKVDYVVVGLQGLHGVDRIRSLGSVARRVIENSKVPVVSVPYSEGN